MPHVIPHVVEPIAYAALMIVRLCKVGLERLSDGSGAQLVEALREREQTPVVRACLERCGVCETGRLVATVDGAPLSVATTAELLEHVDALIAEENA
jgi:uncharacterized protein YuzB (UPF0349 family)